MAKPYRRKTYWIDPQLQGYVLLYFLVFIALFIAFHAVIMSFVANRLTEEAMTMGLGPESGMWQVIADIQSPISYLIAMGVFTSLALIPMYFITHRISGPIFHLQKYLREYDPSEPSKSYRLKFREADFFQPLAEDVNKFIEKNLDPKGKSQ